MLWVFVQLQKQDPGLLCSTLLCSVVLYALQYSVVLCSTLSRSLSCCVCCKCPLCCHFFESPFSFSSFGCWGFFHRRQDSDWFHKDIQVGAVTSALNGSLSHRPADHGSTPLLDRASLTSEVVCRMSCCYLISLIYCCSSHWSISRQQCYIILFKSIDYWLLSRLGTFVLILKFFAATSSFEDFVLLCIFSQHVHLSTIYCAWVFLFFGVFLFCIHWHLDI